MKAKPSANQRKCRHRGAAFGEEMLHRDTLFHGSSIVKDVRGPNSAPGLNLRA